MKIIKWGILGTGIISTQFAKALTSMENTELVAVASRDISKASEFAKNFNIRKAYGSYKELAEDSEIDVVYIGTPHSEHKANAELCIVNGKAVLCEKAFTINQEETLYLINLAKEHNVFLMEAMWTKFLPVTHEVKKWIKNDRIGKLLHLRVNFGYYSKFDINSRLFSPELAGGALLDVGVYPITYVVHMLDRTPDRIISSAIMGQSHVDEQNTIIFEYKDGILADLSSALSVDLGMDAVIIGDKGRIVVPKFFMAEDAILYDENDNLIDTFSEPFRVNGYVYEAMEVNECIREGLKESRILPLKDTLEIMKIMDEIRAQWGLKYPQEEN